MMTAFVRGCCLRLIPSIHPINNELLGRAERLLLNYPVKRDTSIRARMNDVVRAFNAEAFLSAISLALTLPDVCGCRLFPDECSRTRYEKWFDRYIANAYVENGEVTDGFEVKPLDTPLCYFSGADCYQLRCVYLHEGSNAPHVERARTRFNLIQFRLFDEGITECDHIGKTWEEPDGTAFQQIDLDLRRFIRCLQEGIERFLAEHPDMNEDSGSESVYYQPLLDFRKQAAGC